MNIMLVLIARKITSLKVYNSNYIEQLAIPFFFLYVKSEPKYPGTSENTVIKVFITYQVDEAAFCLDLYY